MKFVYGVGICDEDGNSKFSSWVEFVASISGANWQIYVLGRPIGNTKPLPSSPTVLIVIMFLVINFQGVSPKTVNNPLSVENVVLFVLLDLNLKTLTGADPRFILV